MWNAALQAEIGLILRTLQKPLALSKFDQSDSVEFLFPDVELDDYCCTTEKDFSFSTFTRKKMKLNLYRECSAASTIQTDALKESKRFTPGGDIDERGLGGANAKSKIARLSLSSPMMWKEQPGSLSWFKKRQLHFGWGYWIQVQVSYRLRRNYFWKV